MWSATAAVEPSASLACALALLCAARYLRHGGWLSAAALVISSAYAVQFRPESILILPIAGALAWPRLRSDLDAPRGWWMVIAGLGLMAVHIAHLFAVRDAGWGTDAPRFSLGYVAENLRVNGRFYLFDERFPVVLTLLAVLGVWTGRDARERWLVALYFLVFFGIDLVFSAGSYNYGADVPIRSDLPAAGGSGLMPRALPAVRLAPAFPPAPSWRPLISVPDAPVVRGATRSGAARADVEFARGARRNSCPESAVLTQNPAMFTLGSQCRTDVAGSRAPAYAAALNAVCRGLTFTGTWCNVQTRFSRRSAAAPRAGRPELVRESRERINVRLYRLRISNKLVVDFVRAGIIIRLLRHLLRATFSDDNDDDDHDASCPGCACGAGVLDAGAGTESDDRTRPHGPASALPAGQHGHGW